jgi:methionyl-tRNA formyltransferase|tara:strand:+ start:1401 stop:2087 length:687 start_codon:yes stop_codon:yes gene_type:complete
MTDYIVAAVGDWNLRLFEELSATFIGDFHFVAAPGELDEILSTGILPRYIFFPHWRWIVPKATVENYECICFHMTDVPFGRGGTPLQNLIVRGYQDTVLTALKMDEGLDTGPFYIKYPLNLKGSASEIYDRASRLSWDMIKEIITDHPTPRQQIGAVTEFVRRGPEQSKIPDNLNISQIYDYIRMLDAEGYPKAYVEKSNYRFTFENACIDGDQVLANVSITLKDQIR